MSTDGHSERMKVLVIPAFPLLTKLKKIKEVKVSCSNKDGGLATFGMTVDQSPNKSIIYCIMNKFANFRYK